MIYDTLVSYDAGSGGVWLTHFINQHVGYCGIKADRRQFDWWCPAVEWRVNRPFPSSSAKGRCAFRMVPIHNIVNHSGGIDPQHIKTVKTVTNDFKYLIVPYIDKPSSWWDTRRAHLTQGSMETVPSLYSVHERIKYFDDDVAHRVLDDLTITLHCVNMIRLVDKQDPTEYSKLCSVLEVPKLKNWQQHCKSAMEGWQSRYEHGTM